MDKIDYQINDHLCEEAIKELEYVDLIYWVEKHKQLFESISIKPQGLPSIANQHHNGVKYFFIGKFHAKYQQLGQ